MKKQITNNLEGFVLDLTDKKSNFLLPNQKRVMFKFDDDEPVHFNSIVENGKFIIELKQESLIFKKDGKTFMLYIETI
jgi:hypothetical protein